MSGPYRRFPSYACALSDREFHDRRALICRSLLPHILDTHRTATGLLAHRAGDSGPSLPVAPPAAQAPRRLRTRRPGPRTFPTTCIERQPRRTRWRGLGVHTCRVGDACHPPGPVKRREAPDASRIRPKPAETPWKSAHADRCSDVVRADYSVDTAREFPCSFRTTRRIRPNFGGRRMPARAPTSCVLFRDTPDPPPAPRGPRRAATVPRGIEWRRSADFGQINDRAALSSPRSSGSSLAPC